VSEETKQPEPDRILRTLIEANRARVVVVTATQALREMCERHGLVGLPVVALGRAALSGLLLATLTKDEEQVTLQILSKGPLEGLTIDARSSGRVRGFVKRPLAASWTETTPLRERRSLAGVIGTDGVVGVIRDLGLAHNYSGQCALLSGEIDEDVEHYLNTSEQIDSVLKAEVFLDGEGRPAVAAGILVQTLPEARGAALVEFLRDTLRGPSLAEVLGRPEPLSAEAIARAALGQCADGMKILDERPVSFHCPCSRDRARSTLAMLREEDLKEMILETNDAEVACNFCGAKYRFSEGEIDELRRAKSKAGPAN
jgi:molecular chaperone Hsp33